MLDSLELMSAFRQLSKMGHRFGLVPLQIWIFFKGYKVLLIYWSKGKIAQPQGFQGKNKGVTETDNSSMVGRGGFEPPKSLTTDLQSVPFGRSGIFPYIQLLCNGGPSGTRTQDQPVMSREL